MRPLASSELRFLPCSQFLLMTHRGWIKETKMKMITSCALYTGVAPINNITCHVLNHYLKGIKLAQQHNKISQRRFIRLHTQKCMTVILRTHSISWLKCSSGKRGFSRSLKYSFRTPATESMSHSLSVKGSSPGRKTYCIHKLNALSVQFYF